MVGAATPTGGVEEAAVTRDMRKTIMMTISRITPSWRGMAEAAMVRAATPTGGAEEVAVMRDMRIMIMMTISRIIPSRRGMAEAATATGGVEEVVVARGTSIIATANGGVEEVVAESREGASQARVAAIVATATFHGGVEEVIVTVNGGVEEVAAESQERASQARVVSHGGNFSAENLGAEEQHSTTATTSSVRCGCIRSFEE